MGEINPHLTGPESVAFFNDLTKDTPLQDTLKEFQMVRILDSDYYGSAGLGWWRAFKQRHAKKNVTRRGKKFASIRTDWAKLSNIRQVYDVVEDKMIDARIATEIKVPVFTDGYRNVVEESQQFSLKQKLRLTIQSTCFL